MFQFSSDGEPHHKRTKEILKAHPEIRALIGKNPHTAWIVLATALAMFAGAYALREQPWWLVFVLAYAIGAFANMTLFVTIHECAHNLIFASRKLNLLTGIVANLAQVIPSSVSFMRYHLKHHSYQGVHELDADLPSNWEARLVGNSAWRKALWLQAFPIIQILRLPRLKEIRPMDSWILLNWACVFSSNFAVFYFWGPKALAFLFLSLMFSLGFHPLGGRLIQEHFLASDTTQETFSYYGPLNIVALNVGYHNEHHDFQSIPWTSLKKVKQIGGDYYDKLESHRSWTAIWLRFVFDKRLSLFSRVVRSERGKPAVY